MIPDEASKHIVYLCEELPKKSKGEWIFHKKFGLTLHLQQVQNGI
jgi:hypothetical protein